MGQGRSQSLNQGKNSKMGQKEMLKLPDIPSESPLGMMIKYWGSWPSQQGKMHRENGSLLYEGVGWKENKAGQFILANFWFFQ